MKNCDEGALDELLKFEQSDSSGVLKSKIDSFLKDESRERTRFVLITSGGTSVPLERNAVRSIENFSTGRRGAISAEHLLRMGYNVIFLHRDGSVLPFLRAFKSEIENRKLEELFTAASGKMVLRDSVPKELERAFLEHEEFKSKILFLPFTTLSQYTGLLHCICTKLKEYGKNVMLYLAAAVSDYYIPQNEMPTHKIQSSSGKLVLNLEPVPKMITLIVESWSPNAFVVTFKLETDADILEHKAKKALEKYKHNAVVANLLHNRYSNVEIFTPSQKFCIDMTKEDIDKGAEIEQRIVQNLVNFHECFINS